MSRRYVQSSKFNSLDEVIPEVVAVISAKDGIETYTDSQKYFKRNYLDAIRQIVPKFYFTDEQQISGTQVSYPNQIINSHILANKNQNLILPVSALAEDTYLSAIDTPQGFAHFFYKQQSPAEIRPDDFTRNILYPLGVTYKNYSSSAEFADYVSGTLLPSIPMVFAGGDHATADLATLTASAFANDSSGTYKYLANNLGWVYFLNRAGPAGGFDPSTALPALLTNNLWAGRSIVLEDTINVYEEHLWKNQLALSSAGVTDTIIPINYASGPGVGRTEASGETWASGTQLLDRLKTLNRIVYSPHFLDMPDGKVEDAFTTYFETCTAIVDGTLITDVEEAGPLSRFLESMSFAFADRVTEQGELGVLYDIGRCPDEFLDVLAELIGWNFVGSDVDKWRVQLRNAVEIYKMKGTKRSIQYLIDSLFSAGLFNVTASDTLSELWESYIPDLLYYSLATSSQITTFDTYPQSSALHFGVQDYSPTSMETNLKYLVDKILFDLVREFPDNFWLGGKPFPTMSLVVSAEDAVKNSETAPWPGYQATDVWLGPYHIMDTGDQDPTAYGLSHDPFGPATAGGGLTWPPFMTGDIHDVESSSIQSYLEVVYDPSFVFWYRNREYLIPPYEKRQYYTPTQVTPAMIDRIIFYLKCYSVDANFTKLLKTFLLENLTETTDIAKVLNTFLIFTTSKKTPPNYANIIHQAHLPRNSPIDRASLLSLWNGKSSHFLLQFDASSFDWTNQQRQYNSPYGLASLGTVLDQVAPAHAVAEMLLSVSSDVADGLESLTDLTCKEIRPNFEDLYTGSSMVTTNFALCAVDMEALATANGITPHRFGRAQVDNINDVLLSGSTFAAIPRNSLRRRNLHNLLPESKLFTRGGKNNPGSLELSSPFYSSGIGYLPLGFMFSSLSFKEVALKQNGVNGIGKLIDKANLDGVWDICQNLTSPSSIFGYAVSDTFASRAKQTVESSSCNTYGRRGQLPEVLNMMVKAHDYEKYLQASSLVSGAFDEFGASNTNWPPGSTLLTPSAFETWVAVGAIDPAGYDLIQSIANHLINKESADESLHYFEHFKFGSELNKLYNVYMDLYGGHGITNNYELLGGPNIFSHTYGPLIYNSNLDIDGSAVAVSGHLVASSTLIETNIAYGGGSGILSISGTSGSPYAGVGTYAASDASDVFIGSNIEFRNNNIVSAIELVDTANPNADDFTTHPIFSVFDLSRDEQSIYSYAKYLINNQIIKYHRSEMLESFPRVRIKIDNSVSTDLARNLLEPNHEYEVTIKAHNLNVNPTAETTETQSLGFWIHTEPEQGAVWTYDSLGVDKLGNCNVADAWYPQWKRTLVADLSATDGIAVATSLAQVENFTPKDYTFPPVQGSGVFASEELPDIIEKIYDYRCVDPLINTTITPVPSVPLAIANVNQTSLDTLTFRFSTINNPAFLLPQEYQDTFDKIHRTDQKYVLEFFITDPDPEKFVVFEDISIQDVTDYNKAIVETAYGNSQLDLNDLKSVFNYLKDISVGNASRNATNTSSIMEVSGGGRLNYRVNTSMFSPASDSTYEQITEIHIDER